MSDPHQHSASSALGAGGATSAPTTQQQSSHPPQSIPQTSYPSSLPQQPQQQHSRPILPPIQEPQPPYYPSYTQSVLPPPHHPPLPPPSSLHYTSRPLPPLPPISQLPQPSTSSTQLPPLQIPQIQQLPQHVQTRERSSSSLPLGPEAPPDLPVRRHRIPKILEDHFIEGSYRMTPDGYMQATCKYCNSVIRGQKNVTSNFIQHMRRRHGPAYDAFQASSVATRAAKRTRLAEEIVYSSEQTHEDEIIASRQESMLYAEQTAPTPMSTRTSPGPPALHRQQAVTEQRELIGATTDPVHQLQNPQQQLPQEPYQQYEQQQPPPPPKEQVALETKPGRSLRPRRRRRSTQQQQQDSSSTTPPSAHDPSPGSPSISASHQLPSPLTLQSAQSNVQGTPQQVVLLYHALTTPLQKVLTPRTPVESFALPPTIPNNLNHQFFIKREDLQQGGGINFRGAYGLLQDWGTRGGVCIGGWDVIECAHAVKAIGGRKCWAVIGEAQERLEGVRDSLAEAGAWIEGVAGGWREAQIGARMKAERDKRVYLGRLDRIEVDDKVGRGMGMVVGFSTLGVEIVQQCLGVDMLFVRGGCKGLFKALKEIAGVLKPGCQIFGVHIESDDTSHDVALPEDRDDSIILDNRVEETRKVHNEGYAYASAWDQGKNSRDRWTSYCHTIKVTRAQVQAAVRLLFDQNRVLVNPSGAVSLAGMISHVQNPVATTKPKRRSKYVAVIEHPLRKFDAFKDIMKNAYTGDTRDCRFFITERESARKNGNTRSPSKGSALVRLLNAVADAEIREIQAMTVETAVKTNEKSTSDYSNFSLRTKLVLECSHSRNRALDLRRALEKASFSVSEDDTGEFSQAYASFDPVFNYGSELGVVLLCQVILIDLQCQSLASFITAVQAATPLCVESTSMDGGAEDNEYKIAFSLKGSVKDLGNDRDRRAIVDDVAKRVAEIGHNLGGKVKLVRMSRSG